MIKIREYKVTHTIDNAGIYAMPNRFLSELEYSKLAVFRDRVKIIEREIEDSYLEQELKANPNLVVLTELAELLPNGLGESKDPEDKELEALRSKYEELFGKKPSHLAKAKTLKAQIEEKLLETGGSTGEEE